LTARNGQTPLPATDFNFVTWRCGKIDAGAVGQFLRDHKLDGVFLGQRLETAAILTVSPIAVSEVARS